MAIVPFAAPDKKRQSLPQALAKAFGELEKGLGGREAIVEVLASADLNEEYQEVLCAIADPTLASVSLAEICLRSNIMPGHLLTVYQHALIRKVQITALTRVAAKIPDVVEEIAKCALPHASTCPRCDGAKVIEVRPKSTKAVPNPEPKTVECYRCAGKGTINVEGSESQQDRLLSLAKLVDKGGGLSIAVGTQVNTAGGQSVTRTLVADTPLGALQQAVSQILKSRGRALPPPTPAPDGRAVSPPEVAPSVVDATVVEESGDVSI